MKKSNIVAFSIAVLLTTNCIFGSNNDGLSPIFMSCSADIPKIDVSPTSTTAQLSPQNRLVTPDSKPTELSPLEHAFRSPVAVTPMSSQLATLLYIAPTPVQNQNSLSLKRTESHQAGLNKTVSLKITPQTAFQSTQKSNIQTIQPGESPAYNKELYKKNIENISKSYPDNSQRIIIEGRGYVLLRTLFRESSERTFEAAMRDLQIESQKSTLAKQAFAREKAAKEDQIK
ncbi:hypothetical protein KBC04_00640 [Candidatus Babeliales bacterium]|nr:hypothetical protein [Candidatus Babeliales bacterium]MBP9843401.1 hypothetical protein [Candidatus Babeliales bacterium]